MHTDTREGETCYYRSCYGEPYWDYAAQDTDPLPGKRGTAIPDSMTERHRGYIILPYMTRADREYITPL